MANARSSRSSANFRDDSGAFFWPFKITYTRLKVAWLAPKRILICSLLGLFSFGCIAQSSQRIITLAPNITEMVYAVGAGKSVVAVSSWSDTPAQVKALPHIGGLGSVNLEQVLALKPTLIIGMQGQNNPRMVAELTRFHLHVVMLKIQKIKDIAAAIQAVGRLTGHESQGSRVAKKFNYAVSKVDNIPRKERQYTTLAQRAPGSRIASMANARASRSPATFRDDSGVGPRSHKPKVFLQLGAHPLYTIGHNSLINQAISLFGGRNIFGNINKSALEVSTESVLAQKPGVIIGLTPTSLSNWQQWKSLPAVKHGRLVVINSDLLARAGPRFAQGVKQLCRKINAYPNP
jgi:ABC-type Fe3+-hydroxamate transport system substrate-binding protein